MSEEYHSFWDRLWHANYRSEREEKVLAYVLHRIGDGASLRDIVNEEYVRRNASPSEVEDVLARPDLITRAREELERDFASGELDPHRRA